MVRIADITPGMLPADNRPRLRQGVDKDLFSKPNCIDLILLRSMQWSIYLLKYNLNEDFQLTRSYRQWSHCTLSNCLYFDK